ncbi:hypothetical protein HZB00_00320, partial [Candidatus Woesearchaeota archaeon]|nr:hypothetical protein [Candidatus Woesearchaeota archaeon]
MEELFVNNPKTIQDVIGQNAIKLATELNADGIVSISRTREEGSFNAEKPYFEVKVTIFKKVGKGYQKVEYCAKMKKPEPGSMIPLKELLMHAISAKHLQKGDRIVCIQDESMGTGYRGLLAIFDVDTLFFDISANKLAEGIHPEIVEAVLELALEIAAEGREGRKIGTAFILGSRDALKYTKQLIINPFQGLEESMRRITDPQLKETMKEFAQLDGVFFIDQDGIILSA